MKGLKNTRTDIIHGVSSEDPDIEVYCGIVDPKPLEYMSDVELVDEGITCGRCKRVLEQRQELTNSEYMNRKGFRIEKLDHGGARVHYQGDYRNFNVHPDKMSREELEERIQKYFETGEGETEDIFEPNTCACGCGGVPRGKNSLYLQGHDAKHKSKLKQAMENGDEGARKILEEKGWV